MHCEDRVNNLSIHKNDDFKKYDNGKYKRSSRNVWIIFSFLNDMTLSTSSIPKPCNLVLIEGNEAL
jgi:hypothetical protein